ncbi:hypothetical protein CspHIS471_0208020 [Cutaneotrichosporon sp. HIS471]|nr:hypothetical protein CspHIS471_0208020 [Cutaneotrichosporon sp. HIS471]
MVASERTPLLSSAGSSTLASPTPETTKFGSFVLPPVPNAKTLPPVPAKITGDGTPAPLHRSRPLKETMTRTRLVVILAGIWSSNFAYALQSTAIPTLAPTIASSFQHAELAAYLGSVFTLANTAFIPLPVVLFCATIVFVFLPEPPIAPTHTSLLHGLISLDWAGVVLLSTSTASLILGLSFHTSYFRPWSHPSVYGLLIASAMLLVAFVWTEMRAERPIVPMGLFKTSQLRAIWTSAVLLMIGSQALLFHVPTYFAVLMDMPAAEAGWVLSVCSGIGLSTGTLFAGHHIRRGGRYTWLGVISLLPSIWGAWIAATWQPNWPTWGYYATILPLNTGYAVYLCVSLIALISSVDSRAMPKATALLYTVRSLGATLGVSLGGSIQVGALVRALRQRFGDMAGGEVIIDAVVHSKAAIKDLPKRYAKMALDAYAVSLRTVWIASGCVAVVAVVCASFIQQNEIHKGDEPHEPPRAEQDESA